MLFHRRCLFQVQPNVLTLFPQYMNRLFSPEFHFLLLHSIHHRHDLNLSGHQVVAWTGRNKLGELAARARNQLPMRVLLPNGVDLDLDARQTPVIWPPGRAKNQARMFFVMIVFFRKK